MKKDVFMGRKIFIGIMFVAAILIIYSSIFDVVNRTYRSKDCMQYSERIGGIGRLLSEIDVFKQTHGKMPANLNELKEQSPRIKDIDIELYLFSPKDNMVLDGIECMLLINDPLHKNRVIVGRLLPPTFEGGGSLNNIL